MDSQPPTPPGSDQGRGLPPVTPPSGRFIAQLFLVPGTIVVLAVLLMVAFSSLLGGNQDPAGFLRQLDNENADVRWRGAADLAQVLKRPENVKLRSDPAFALDLAQRLRTGLDELLQEEKRIQEKTAQSSQTEKDAAWGKPLDARRNYVNFLAATMGDFTAPVGVPLLTEILMHADSPDPRNILRRRQALRSLITLGNNVEEFKKMPAKEQGEITDLLVKEAQAKDPNRAAWARHGLYYLDKSKLPAGGIEGIVMMDQVLAKVAQDQDQFLRELTAFAFNFWDGPLAEPTLLKLARDKGQGMLIRISE